MKIELNLTLHRLSLLSAAQAVWELKDIQDEVINHFLNTKVLDRKNEWNVIIKKALRKIPVFFLPSVLRCELLYAVKSTGIRIYDWFMYLRNIKFISNTISRNDYDKYLKKIYWTYYGTIDEVKTLKYFWLNNASIECWKVFDLACCFCVKDAIVDLWEKYPATLSSRQNCHLYRKYSLHVLEYWVHHQNSTLDNLMLKIQGHTGDVDSIYENNYSIEENMLRASVKSGHHLAVQYFWNTLNNEQKERNAVFCLKTALGFVHKYEDDADKNARQYVRDRCIVICIFLFNNMTDEAKKKVFEQVYWSDGEPKVNENMENFIEIFMTSYPWQDFIAPVVMELRNKNYSTFNYLEHRIIFSGMTNQMISDDNSGLPIDNSVVQRQFFMLWQIIPPALKFELASLVLFKCLDLWNIKLIRFILNDKDLKMQKTKLLDVSYGLCKYPYNEENEMIDEFIDNILIFDDWENDVKALMKKLYRYLKVNKIKEASEELFSAQIIKGNDVTKTMIDHKLLYYFFVKKNCLDLADGFLWWALDYSTFSVEDFKLKFSGNEKFSRYYIYNLWTKADNFPNFLKAEELSTKYLHQILNLNSKDETIKYINKLLQNLKVLKYSELQTFFILKNKFNSLDKFLNWCSRTSNKPVPLKDEFIKQGYIEKICKRYIGENNFSSAEQLLKWGFSGSNEKILNFKHTFLTSAKGSEVLKYFIATVNSNEVNPELRKNEIIVKFKDFINFWIKPLKDIGEIVKTLNAWNRTVGQNIRDDVNEANLDFEENETAVDGFLQYKRSNRQEVFWDTGNYVLFINLLGCSHCHFMKSLNNSRDECDD